MPVCLWTRTWFMSFHLILKSSVLVLPTALYMGSHPIRVVTFFSTENTPTHPPWLCFNALQVYLLQHLESLNRHTALSSVYRHTHTHTHKCCEVCTSGDLFTCHFNHFQCGCMYMRTSKSVYFTPFSWLKKRRFAWVCKQTNCFGLMLSTTIQWGNFWKPKVIEMEHYNSNNYFSNNLIWFSTVKVIKQS